MIDQVLLLSLFRFPAPSGQEADFRTFLMVVLAAWKVPFAMDEVGNLFSPPRPGLPLLVAHLDTAQTAADCSKVGKIQLDPSHRVPITGLVRSVVRGEGIIGADDKAGVYLILELLRRGLAFDFVFTVQEETNLAGARHYASQRSWETVPYCLVLDMWGEGEVVCAQRHFGTKRFERDLLALDPHWSTHSGFESGSDAEVFSHYVCTANLSVGYNRQHQPDEYLDLQSLESSLAFVQQALTSLRGPYRRAPGL